MDATKKQVLVDELLTLRGLPYKDNCFDPAEGGLFCWGFFNWAFKRAAEIFEMSELILPKDIYEAERNFRLVDKTLLQFLDIVVMKEHSLSSRHVGLMLDDRWFMHCSKSTGGVGRSELTRDPYRQLIKHYGRHKALDVC